MSQPHPTHLVGRVLRSSTSRFTVGCKALLPEVPNFGSLVRVQVPDGQTIYGLIYDVSFGDDMLVRQMIGTPDIPVEVIRDQRENRQIPIEVSILTVGHHNGAGIRQYLPPQPPPIKAGSASTSLNSNPSPSPPPSTSNSKTPHICITAASTPSSVRSASD